MTRRPARILLEWYVSPRTKPRSVSHTRSPTEPLICIRTGRELGAVHNVDTVAAPPGIRDETFCEHFGRLVPLYLESYAFPSSASGIHPWPRPYHGLPVPLFVLSPGTWV